MTKNDVLTWLKRRIIVPVVRAASPEQALGAVEALLDGGIDVLEITMTVPGAIDVVREVTQRYGDRALVGAGTVLDPGTAEACVDAGAKFIVSPAVNADTVQICHSMNVVVAPGALTPTEVLTAWNLGADIVKVFPADAAGGPSYIKSLRAPFPDILLMPTGGVTLANLPDYLAAGAVAVGVGSNLVDLKLDRPALTARARDFIAAAGPASA